ncbi:NAD dependent epimerase/dehydratase [Sarocladium implicatum]|nr:NAD dependent epimerase/dehydratase [Sarocladium implicatum]
MAAVDEAAFTNGREVPMRVIVAGVHRTGTLSMRAALCQLGFFDCYHMHSAQANGARDGPQWARALEAKYNNRGTFTRADWDRLLGKYQACCDIPPAFFSAELAEAYPEAKVVILNRDPEKWYESVLNSIYKVMTQMTLWDKAKMVYRAALDPEMRGVMAMSRAFKLPMPYDHGKEKDKALAWYKAQYDEFRERIPAERRLEFSVKDGWEPLCEFLEVPVPMIQDEETGKKVVAPFPRTNDAESLEKTVGKWRGDATRRANTNLLVKIGEAATFGAVGFAIYWNLKGRIGGRA